jgi:hypothetical protein
VKQARAAPTNGTRLAFRTNGVLQAKLLEHSAYPLARAARMSARDAQPSSVQRFDKTQFDRQRIHCHSNASTVPNSTAWKSASLCPSFRQGVLRAHQVDFRQAAAQAADYSAVHICVTCQSELRHSLERCAVPAVLAARCADARPQSSLSRPRRPRRVVSDRHAPRRGAAGSRR